MDRRPLRSKSVFILSINGMCNSRDHRSSFREFYGWNEFMYVTNEPATPPNTIGKETLCRPAQSLFRFSLCFRLLHGKQACYGYW